MNELIAYCGLQCSSCTIYLAAREINIVKREQMISEIIRVCKKEYGIEYSPVDITHCDGCKSDSQKIFSGCANCKIRNCVVNKGISSCAYCDEYFCDNLKELFEKDPGAKKRLDILRSRK